MGRILVTGSVAFDTIMQFAGRFADVILPDQTHQLNVSFLVDRLERRRGGTAANVAYSLALLGERPLLCAGVGSDFGGYAAALEAVGVDTRPALRCDDVATASGFITTDADGNQITAFFPGAMARSAEVDLLGHGDVEHVVVGADAPAGMDRHVSQAGELGARLVFAPAQQIPSMTDEALRDGLLAAWLVAGNAYEFELIRARTGLTVEELATARIVAVTRGGEGSRLHTPDRVVAVPAVPPRRLVDPTGAGDAYVAGLLAGLRRGLTVETAGRMAALAATHVLEGTGPQTHGYTPVEFAARYAETFGDELPSAPPSASPASGLGTSR